MATDWYVIEQRVVRTLQDLIRINTTNPPGNEIQCARYIHERLAGAGIESEIVEPEPGRGNVVGRLRGDGSKRPLLFLSHIDVVPVEADKWKHAPFSGTLAGGYVWGRGAIDTKNLTAIQLECMLLAKEQGLPLKRDLILAATCDEETGGLKGAGYLANNRFELIDAEYAINEGGGFGMNIGDRWAFLCQTAEKGGCRIILRGRGNPGHASMPFADCAVGRLAIAVERLLANRLPMHRVATVEQMVKELAQVLPPAIGGQLMGVFDPQTEASVLALLPESLSGMLAASLHNTAAPTILRAGNKINVIPSVAEAEVDCRILPGQTPEMAAAEIRAVVGDSVEVEVMGGRKGIEAPAESPFFDTIRSAMDSLVPGSVLLPFMMPGGTDARHLAPKGVKVYGFCPLQEMPGEEPTMRMAHGHNERISVANLRFGARGIWEVMRRWCAE